MCIEYHGDALYCEPPPTTHPPPGAHANFNLYHSLLPFPALPARCHAYFSLSSALACHKLNFNLYVILTQCLNFNLQVYPTGGPLGGPKVAVEDLFVHVGEGEILGLLGANGAGVCVCVCVVAMASHRM